MNRRGTKQMVDKAVTVAICIAIYYWNVLLSFCSLQIIISFRVCILHVLHILPHDCHTRETFAEILLVGKLVNIFCWWWFQRYWDFISCHLTCLGMTRVLKEGRVSCWIATLWWRNSGLTIPSSLIPSPRCQPRLTGFTMKGDLSLYMLTNCEHYLLNSDDW